MSVKEDSTSERARKKKREYNKFVYNVVNELTLSEFKKYTNIRELMKNALLKRDETERQQLDYYIKQNFKQNIPNETLWKKGGFVSLTFENDFYDTKAAQRAFHNVFGTKKCSVNLEKIHVDAPQEADMHLQVDIADQEMENREARIEKVDIADQEVEMENREAGIEKIDLTEDDSDVRMYPPKRMVLKYPSKRVVCTAEPFGIVENICETTFEEIGDTQHSTTADMLNDEIVISSTEDTVPKKTIEGLAVISDVILIPAPETPLQKESAQVSSSDCLTKIVFNQSPNRQIKLPIREIQSPIHQGQLSTREMQSSRNQEQSLILQRESGIMFPKGNTESSTRNNPQQAFTTQSQRQSVTVVPKDVAEPPPLNTQQKLNCQSKGPSKAVMPENSTEIASSQSNIRRVFNAQMSFIQFKFEKYLLTTPAFNWSLKHFWAELLQLDHQNECSLRNTGNVLQMDVNCATSDEDLQASIEIAESHPTNAIASLVQTVENSATMTHIDIKNEQLVEPSLSNARPNVSNTSKVKINDIPLDRSIEIVNNSNQSSINHLNHNDSQDEENRQQVEESYNKSGSTAPSTSEGILAPGNEMLQNQSSIDVADDQPANGNVSIVHTVENSDMIADIKIKIEKMSESNASFGSDVEIIDVLPDSPIEIMDCSTQDLINNLELDRHDSQDPANFMRPFAIPQQITESYTKSGSKRPSTSKSFLTALPSHTNKKRIYKPLDIAVESVKDTPAVVLPNHDFSQQPDSTSPPENYEIEEFTMTESQIQRYELLNNENSLFVSSQLDNYKLNTGNQVVPSAHQVTATLPTVKESVTQKRPSSTLEIQSNKRRRILRNIVAHELHWKILNIKTFIFQPLTENTFNLEIQLRNNFDKFYLNDQHSIKKLLNVSDKVWEHVVNILKALNSYEYQVSNSTLSQNSDVLHRVMDNFVRSIPGFVKSRIHFRDFMGNLLEVSERLPLDKKCANSCIEPNVLKRMIEFKKNLNNKAD